jgi:hypothetical protein
VLDGRGTITRSPSRCFRISTLARWGSRRSNSSSRSRDPQDPAQRGEAMGGPVRRHELESLDGIEPVSLANQAAVDSTDERNSGCF